MVFNFYGVTRIDCRALLIVVLCSMISCRVYGSDCDLSSTNYTFTGLRNTEREMTTIDVSCDEEYQIALDAGRWFFGSRQLRNNSNEMIQYRLWADLNGVMEWGDLGFGGTYAAPPVIVGAGGSNTHKVFGRIYLDQGTLPSGIYRDSVGITLGWPPYGDDQRKKYTLDLTFLAEEQCDVDVSGIRGFGTWPAGGADPEGIALGSVGVTCTSGVQYALGIDAGQHYNGNHRRLLGQGSSISYILRTEKNGREWGDTGLAALSGDYVETHPGTIQTGNGNGLTQHFFVWGDAEISGKSSGNYADRVDFTVVW